MSGGSTALGRSVCGAEHVKALLQTAALGSPSAFNSNTRSASVSSSWSHHRRGLSATFRRKLDGTGLVSQQDGIGTLMEHFTRISDQLSRPLVSPRGRVREDNDSKGSNHSFESKRRTLKEPSLLLSLVQEIQPLDVSQISKEVSSDSTDAMKRTISGMLGLLPSDQFNVTVETSWDPLAKLLVSSMMTGYTLRNAEYRLCLQKSLEVSGQNEIQGMKELSMEQDALIEGVKSAAILERERVFVADGVKEVFEEIEPVSHEAMETVESLGSISEETKLYIDSLKQKLAFVSQELEDCKRVNAGLQVHSMVGEEKNDLLDYLRSLPPDKVAELSQPTSSEVEDAIEQVITVLLDDSTTKLQHKASPYGSGKKAFNPSWEEDGTRKFTSSPLQSQSAVTVNRDHLARMLFWCMLMGHHVRGLEYRLELSRTLSLSGDLDSGTAEEKQDG